MVMSTLSAGGPGLASCFGFRHRERMDIFPPRKNTDSLEPLIISRKVLDLLGIEFLYHLPITERNRV